jgi:hypothetical protein
LALMPARRAILARGIGRLDAAGDLRVYPHLGGVRFAAHSVDGPGDVSTRTLWMHLSRGNIAELLGALPATELAEDPGVWQAFLTLRGFLMKENDGNAR